jgi:hypothetical protein
LDDANRALDLGGDQSVTTQAVSGVLAFADGDYDTAVRRFRDAVELNDQTPGVLLYLSAAETARDNAAAADRWRDRAIALLDGSEPSDRNRQLAAAYYTALEWVAHDVPEQAVAAREQRDGLIELETSFIAGERVSDSAPDDATLRINDIVVADDTVDFDLDVAVSTLRTRSPSLPTSGRCPTVRGSSPPRCRTSARPSRPAGRRRCEPSAPASPLSSASTSTSTARRPTQPPPRVSSRPADGFECAEQMVDRRDREHVHRMRAEARGEHVRRPSPRRRSSAECREQRQRR